MTRNTFPEYCNEERTLTNSCREFFNKSHNDHEACKEHKWRKLKINELNRINTEEFKKTKKIPLIVILDNVRSLHNVGSVFRTCDAFLVEAVYLCGITATPPHAEIHKSALGAENAVDWQYFHDTSDAVNDLKQRGWKIVAVEQAENSIPLDRLQLDKERYAFILGNEVKGVAQNIMNLCDSCIEIPQLGTKHSLNVSVVSGILIWESFKQLKNTIDICLPDNTTEKQRVVKY
jgi:tRNA G18 (ribose-2'-O)-methylase SpoU